MFLQSKYGKQVSQDTRTTNFGLTTGFQAVKHEIKFKPPVVGSVTLGRMNFEQGEQIFPKEDVPVYKVEAKNQMAQLVDPDILGLRKKGWNKSTYTRDHNQEEDFERKLTKIKLGFFDTPLPKYREAKIEAGTDTRNEYMGWNVSTEPTNKFQNQRNINELTKQSIEKTKTHFKKISDYKNPTQTIRNFNDTLRQTKRDEQEIRTQFKEKMRFENPSATEERINAGVNRLVYEHKVANNRPQSEDPTQKLTFKPDLSKTLTQNFGSYAYHNGSYGKHPLAQEKEVWSCCMMERRTGEGCVKVKVNRDKWILDSCGTVYG